MQSILITGANGFIGKALCRTLLAQGIHVRAVVRSDEKARELRSIFTSSVFECRILGDMTMSTDWSNILKDVDAVVHLAARVHQADADAPDHNGKYQNLNVVSTQHLANASVTAKVKRFLYLSSIGVNGRVTNSKPFTEIDTPNPHNTYALSKWQAEQALQEVSNRSDLKITILRPPIVYGKGVKANFQSLLKLVQSGLPIPLASVKNQRSLVYVENLVDAIITCLRREEAAGRTYLVSDAEVVSTPDLIRQIAAVLGKAPRLLPFPLGLLRFGATLMGKGSMVDRLVESLVMDCSKINKELGWVPPYTLQDALQRDFGLQELKQQVELIS